MANVNLTIEEAKAVCTVVLSATQVLATTASSDQMFQTIAALGTALAKIEEAMPGSLPPVQGGYGA